MAPLPKTKHPLFDTTIPSTKQKISYRPMLGREEKILLMARESTEESTDTIRGIRQVVRNCILNTDVDTDQLATFDVDYLFLKIRSVSIGGKVEVSHTDEVTGEVRPFTINLDDVKVIWPNGAAPNEKGQTLDNTLIKINDKLAIKMRYPRAEAYGNKDIFGDDEKSIDKLIAHCIDKIYDDKTTYDVRENTPEEIVEFIDDLDLDTMNKIRKFLAEVPHLSYTIKFVDSQKVDRTIELRSLYDFFLF